MGVTFVQNHSRVFIRILVVGAVAVSVVVAVAAEVVLLGLTSEHVHIAIARSAGLKSTASRSKCRSFVRLSEENALIAYIYM